MLDDQQARDVVASYGHLVDARDWVGLASIFTPDATIEWVNEHGRTKLTVAEVLPLWEEYDHPSAHLTTNLLSEAAGADRIRVRSKGLAVESDGLSWSVTYDDQLVRTSGGWRIAERVVNERPSAAREQRATRNKR
jgi:hypothetical protein